jgi:hypothetical protein
MNPHQQNPGSSFCLRFCPSSYLTAVVDLEVNYIRPTANWAILDILLVLSQRNVDRNDNLFATGTADVGCFVRHAFILAGLRNSY